MISIVLWAQTLVQEPVFPTTVSGWFGLVVVVLTLIGSLVAYGKRGEQMRGLGERLKRDIDGLGGRVQEVEMGQERILAALAEHDLSFERTTSAQTSILEKLGKAERSAETCSDEMQKYAIDIGVKVGAITKQLSKTELELSNRLVGVEKELQLTRELERERMRSRGDSR